VVEVQCITGAAKVKQASPTGKMKSDTPTPKMKTRKDERKKNLEKARVWALDWRTTGSVKKNKDEQNHWEHRSDTGMQGGTYTSRLQEEVYGREYQF
jgi:hypothetical protein